MHDLERVTDRLVDLYAAVLEPSRVRGAVAVPTAPPEEPGPALPLGDTELDGEVPARPAVPRDELAVPSNLGSQLRRLGRHSAIYGIGGLVSRVIAVLLLPVYTRYLSPADYGQIETLLALTTVMGLLLRAGITSAFFRFYFDVDDDRGRLRVLRTSFWFTMGGGTLGLAFLLLLAGPDLDPPLRHRRGGRSRARLRRRPLGDGELRAADRALPGRGALDGVRLPRASRTSS